MMRVMLKRRRKKEERKAKGEGKKEKRGDRGNQKGIHGFLSK